jgi:hypothetical protein
MQTADEIQPATAPLQVGPAKYSGAGYVEFREYGNGQTAIRIIGDEGPECTATVNLEELGAPEPGPDQVWLKTWSGNQGIEAALEAAGIVKLTGERFHCNHDAYAVLADLTPAAIAARAAQ